jgi:hypothetical protein
MPTHWLAQIETELRRIQPGENPGRTRTIARRAAGIALKKFYGNSGEDYMVFLRQAATDPLLPEEVRRSALRLTARVTADFQSESVDPVGDAMIIVQYVQENVIS